MKSLPWRGPTSTKPSHRASVPFSPGRSWGCLQHPIVGDPGAVAVTAARATEEEEDDSMSRASVAKTGWATRRGREGGERGGEGRGAEDDDASSSTDDEHRRRRRRPAAAAAVVERAIGGGLFFRSSSRVCFLVLKKMSRRRSVEGSFEEPRERPRWLEKGKEEEK